VASAEHIKYRKMEFRPNVPDTLFSEDEIEQLINYGSWLAALMRGAITPETPAQERFIEVCRGNKEPQSQFEKVWAKYMKRKIWESENPDYVGKQEADLLLDLGITGRGWGVYGHFK